MSPVSIFSSVLCAVDASSLAPRVFRHAAGLAAACGADLTVLTITPHDTRRAEVQVRSMMRAALGLDTDPPDSPHLRIVHLSVGQPIDAILEEVRDGVDVVVVGTHARSDLSRWLLGSTSASLLEEALCPILLVPPGQVEIVTVADHHATFRPSAVLAAVDLHDHEHRVLALASELSALVQCPLSVMTVADAATTDEAAATELRARVQALGHTPIEHVIVQRGVVPAAIDQAAVAEHAGLVVMSVRAWGGNEPGDTARAVLKTRDAVVLAVPAA
jgi:nucleotide-binding universal stress UspA family protein